MKILRFIVITISVAILLCVTVTAAQDSAVLTLPSETVFADEYFYVDVSVTYQTPFYAHSFRLEYDPTVVSFVEGDDCNLRQEGVLLCAKALVQSNTVNTSIKFRVNKNASATFKVSDICVADGNSEYYFNDITKTFNVAFDIKGDFNYDGVPDIEDLAVLKKVVAGLSTLEDMGRADMNGDQEVNVLDLSQLKKVVAGLE